jgi:hypothetical protein
VIVAASIFLLPVMLMGAAVSLLIARKLRLVPRRGAWTAYLLFLCLEYGLLYIGTTLDALIATPHRLQKEFLGKRVAGPIALVRYESGGFQDPYQNFSLSGAIRELVCGAATLMLVALSCWRWRRADASAAEK